MKCEMSGGRLKGEEKRAPGVEMGVTRPRADEHGALGQGFADAGNRFH